MITDTAALLVLAVIAGMSTGEVNQAFWWRLGVSLVVFVTAILVGLPLLGRRFFLRFPKDGPGQFVFVLTSVFFCAALSNVAGLEPIVGAFLAGLALNRLIPRASPLMNRLVFTGEAIFIPFFLLSVGMLLDARVLFGGLETWEIAVAMTATAVGAKYLAAGATRVLFRYRKEEGRVMFGLSVVQAAATLASVMVGHRIGLFDDAVVNGTIVMILITCVLGPAVVSKFAPALAAAAEAAPAELQATRGVLVPLLSASQAQSAMELALVLRGDDKAAPIYPAFVTAEHGDFAHGMTDADKILAGAVSQASAADCVVEPIKRVHDDPGRALVLARKELGVSYVVIPWNAAPAGGESSMGHVVDALIADAEVSTFLARLPHPLGTCARVALLLPPSVGSGGAFDAEALVVLKLCRDLGADLLAIVPEHDEAAVREALRRRAEVRSETRPYASMSMLLPTMGDHVRGSDLIVVHGARDGEPGFSADYGLFTARVFSRFAGNDVILLYPRSPAASVAAVGPLTASHLVAVADAQLVDDPRTAEEI